MNGPSFSQSRAIIPASPRAASDSQNDDTATHPPNMFDTHHGERLMIRSNTRRLYASAKQTPMIGTRNDWVF